MQRESHPRTHRVFGYHEKRRGTRELQEMKFQSFVSTAPVRYGSVLGSRATHSAPVGCARAPGPAKVHRNERRGGHGIENVSINTPSTLYRVRTQRNRHYKFVLYRHIATVVTQGGYVVGVMPPSMTGIRDPDPVALSHARASHRGSEASPARARRASKEGHACRERRLCQRYCSWSRARSQRLLERAGS